MNAVPHASPASGRSLALAFGWALACLPAAAAEMLRLAMEPETEVGQVQLSWFAENLRPYQLEGSADLIEWEECCEPIIGADADEDRIFSRTEPTYFYRLRKGAIRPGFRDDRIPATDDGSSDVPIPFGFPIRIFPSAARSGPWTEGFVNNNGSITIGTPVSTYTPLPLQNAAEELVGLVALFAPFWADVDTSIAFTPGTDVKEVTYGTGTVNGHPAFGANWVDVGYYSYADDKLNSFQMILISRPDTGHEANFDIEFNYNQILWETGSHHSTGGKSGYGGKPARCGITNGSNQTLELTYSGDTLLQLDSNPSTGQTNYATGLIYRSRNSTMPGRFIFQVRDGTVLGALEVSAGDDIVLPEEATEVTLAGTAIDPSAGNLTIRWSVVEGSKQVLISDCTVLDPVVTVPAGESATLQLTVISTEDPNISAADIIKITRE